MLTTKSTADEHQENEGGEQFSPVKTFGKMLSDRTDEMQRND
jgi:hypothetical protein